MLAYSYFNKSSLDTFSDGWLKASSSYGNMVGQFSFAILVDIFGRKRIYGIELIILIIGALGSALLSWPIGNLSVIGALAFWRFILGVGVGGDYSVSAVIASEFSTSKYRGTMIAIVFAMQGVGIILGALMSLIVLSIFKNSIIKDPSTSLNYCWRILAGFGIVPALCAVYYRFKIPQSPRYLRDVLKDLEGASKATEDFLNGKSNNDKRSNISYKYIFTKYTSTFKEYFSKWVNFKVLLGCALCWFFVDIGYYGTSLNTNLILGYIGYGKPTSSGNQKIFDDLWNRAMGTMIINIAGTVPGYWFTVVFVDTWGRKPIQYMGFTFLTIIFGSMSIFYTNLTSNQTTIFVVLYAFAQFFFNFGPNSTTFIIPAEVFPTRIRATGHGISAASGKLGAILAAQCFSLVANSTGGLQLVLGIFSACCFVGGLLTMLIPETKGLSLEDINPSTPMSGPTINKNENQVSNINLN
jgi:PHS family inorganic phosphate transporter-like MFS transporter